VVPTIDRRQGGVARGDVAPEVAKRDDPTIEAAHCWTEVQGRWMHSLRWGAPAGCPPIVVVHGMVVAARSFDPTASHLARQAQVLGPDLPGYGRSDADGTEPMVPDLADALAAWCDARPLTRARWVANSFGCQVLVELALARPDLVESMVLVSPTLDPRARHLGELLARWQREQSTQSWTLRRRMVHDWWVAGPARGLATVRAALADRIEDKLPAVAAPALVVHGTRDPISPRHWCEQVADELPDGRLAVLPGVPHNAGHDGALPLSRVSAAFFAGRRPGGWSRRNDRRPVTTHEHDRRAP
jgi:2-hydroxy-6-oxonona-2,4-dienedioate hydrolase